jgi:hypothetical protein
MRAATNTGVPHESSCSLKEHSAGNQAPLEDSFDARLGWAYAQAAAGRSYDEIAVSLRILGLDESRIADIAWAAEASVDDAEAMEGDPLPPLPAQPLLRAFGAIKYLVEGIVFTITAAGICWGLGFTLAIFSEPIFRGIDWATGSHSSPSIWPETWNQLNGNYEALLVAVGFGAWGGWLFRDKRPT